jgi:hypothetical protein
VTTDSKSGIVNDVNQWGLEQDYPRYIVDLVKRVVTVSIRTVEIVNALPELEFGQSSSQPRRLNEADAVDPTTQASAHSYGSEPALPETSRSQQRFAPRPPKMGSEAEHGNRTKKGTPSLDVVVQ